MSYNYDADLEVAKQDAWTVFCGISKVPSRRQWRKYPQDVCNYLNIERM